MHYFLIRACPELDSGMPFANTPVCVQRTGRYKSVMESYLGHGLTFCFIMLYLPVLRQTGLHILRGVERIIPRLKGGIVVIVVLIVCRYVLV